MHNETRLFDLINSGEDCSYVTKGMMFKTINFLLKLIEKFDLTESLEEVFQMPSKSIYINLASNLIRDKHIYPDLYKIAILLKNQNITFPTYEVFIRVALYDVYFNNLTNEVEKLQPYDFFTFVTNTLKKIDSKINTTSEFILILKVLNKPKLKSTIC